MRFLKVLLLLCCCVLSMAVSARERMSDTASPIAVINVRDERLLGEVRMSGADMLDELLIDIGKKGVSNSTPKINIRGWNCEPKKSEWRCAGQPQQAVYVAFDPVGKYQFPDKVKLEVRSGGRTLFEERLPVGYLKTPAVQTNIADILNTPANYVPGGYFTARPLNPAYQRGTWNVQVDGQTIPRGTYDGGLIDQLPENNRTLADYTYQMPESLQLNSQLSYTYDDPWGDRLVDAPVENFSIGETGLQNCEPAIRECQGMAPIGGTLCVCGCFPTLASGASLLLDGQAATVTSGSTYVTSISLLDVEPGRHRVSFASGRGGSVEFEAVRVAGKLDKEVIMKGGSAKLEFWMEGTREPLDMKIRSADLNIGIQGGNIQTVTTSGGVPNDIQRTLWANEVGDFNVNFAVNLPPCPCGYQEHLGIDESLVQHPMDIEGQGDLLWPGTGLSYPVKFNSEDFLSLAPPPPVSTEPFKLPLRQLGLTAKIGEFAPFSFETRADLGSFGEFSNIRINDEGYLRSADVDVDFRTEFSVEYSDSMPLKVGLRYDFGLQDWSFKGNSPDLGEVDFSQIPGTESSIVIDKMETDVAGTLLHGWADISLRGKLSIGGAANGP